MPISKASAEDGIPVEAPYRVHPVVWMSIGVAVFAAVFLFAVLFGFLDRTADEQTLATTSAPVPSKEWWKELGGTEVATAATKSRDNWWDSFPEADRSTAALSDEAPDPARTAKPKGRGVWDDEQAVADPASSDADSANRRDDPIVDDSPVARGGLPEALSAEDLYDRVAPSVVTIYVKDENDEHIVTGSGFFVDSAAFGGRYWGLEGDKWLARMRSKNGVPVQTAYVLTNYHVIRPAVAADIVLLNGDKGTAEKVIAENAEADLALLSVLVPANRLVAGIPLATGDPRVGATVYAIGSPVGLSSSLSQGIVSGFRDLNEGGRWLQTTAPISHGSSGGPLVLSTGHVTGVTTLTRDDGQNVNFAIPVSKVRDFLLSQYQPRDIAEGASVWWHEMDAFVEMSVVMKNGHSHTESQAAVVLEKAWQEMRNGHYDQANSLAQDSEQSLPDEYKYLAAYIAGSSSMNLAYEASYKDHTIKTVDGIRARYRANDHALAALRHLVRATKLKPDFSPAFKSLAIHNRYAGNWADALLASDALVKLMPRGAEALRLRAECYDELNRPESARDDLQAAIELAPRRGELHHQLAGVFKSLGDYAEAIACYEHALELKYAPEAVHVNLGLTYQHMGQFEKAISQFELAKAAGWPADYCDFEIAKCRRSQQ